jgi:hypothetical protein
MRAGRVWWWAGVLLALYSGRGGARRGEGGGNGRLNGLNAIDGGAA